VNLERFFYFEDGIAVVENLSIVLQAH